MDNTILNQNHNEKNQSNKSKNYGISTQRDTIGGVTSGADPKKVDKGGTSGGDPKKTKK